MKAKFHANCQWRIRNPIFRPTSIKFYYNLLVTSVRFFLNIWAYNYTSKSFEGHIHVKDKSAQWLKPVFLKNITIFVAAGQVR